MPFRTVSRAYESTDDAMFVVHALEAAGIAHGDISLLGAHAEGLEHHGIASATEAAAGTGATVGTLLGGGVGLLAGLGALAIPGVGPLIAAGWLVATLTGAGLGAAAGTAAGGLVGSLADLGVSDEDAHVYAEGLRRGGALVSVRAQEDDAPRVESLLMHRVPIDPATRRLEYSGHRLERRVRPGAALRAGAGTRAGVRARAGERRLEGRGRRRRCPGAGGARHQRRVGDRRRVASRRRLSIGGVAEVASMAPLGGEPVQPWP